MAAQFSEGPGTERVDEAEGSVGCTTVRLQELVQRQPPGSPRPGSQDPHKGLPGRESRAEGAVGRNLWGKGEIRQRGLSVLLEPGGQSGESTKFLQVAGHFQEGVIQSWGPIWNWPGKAQKSTRFLSGHVFSVQSLPEPPWAPGTRSSGPSEAGPTLQG